MDKRDSYVVHLTCVTIYTKIELNFDVFITFYPLSFELKEISLTHLQVFDAEITVEELVLPPDVRLQLLKRPEDGGLLPLVGVHDAPVLQQAGEGLLHVRVLEADLVPAVEAERLALHRLVAHAGSGLDHLDRERRRLTWCCCHHLLLN